MRLSRRSSHFFISFSFSLSSREEKCRLVDVQISAVSPGCLGKKLVFGEFFCIFSASFGLVPGNIGGFFPGGVSLAWERSAPGFELSWAPRWAWVRRGSTFSQLKTKEHEKHRKVGKSHHKSLEPFSLQVKKVVTVKKQASGSKKVSNKESEEGL